MYRKEDILRKLNEDNYYIDIKSLESFIKDWQLDSIYEAKDGTEFYDDIVVYKLKKGISLKSQGYNNEQICYRIHKTPLDMPQVIEEELKSTEVDIPSQQVPEVRNVTLNVTNQTLQMLAEAVAGKITDDIKNHIDTSQFSEKLIEAGEYKKDNEALAKQVVQLLKDNQALAKRVEHLEKKSKSFWKRLFG